MDCTNSIFHKVMTFNIHAGIGLDGVKDELRLSGVIKESGADIIVLNEVDCHTQRSKGVDQLGVIAQDLGFYSFYGSSMDFQGGRYGNGILSRYPITHSEVHPLPRIGDTEPRSLAVCCVDIGGRKVNVLATHLSLEEEERRRSAEYIKKLVSSLEGPVILMGDFNAYSGSREIGIISEILEDTGEAPDRGIKTFPASCPEDRIDYIFLSHHFRLYDIKTIATGASDHLPLVASIREV